MKSKTGTSCPEAKTIIAEPQIIAINLEKELLNDFSKMITSNATIINKKAFKIIS